MIHISTTSVVILSAVSIGAYLVWPHLWVFLQGHSGAEAREFILREMPTFKRHLAGVTGRIASRGELKNWETNLLAAQKFCESLDAVTSETEMSAYRWLRLESQFHYYWELLEEIEQSVALGVEPPSALA